MRRFRKLYCLTWKLVLCYCSHYFDPTFQQGYMLLDILNCQASSDMSRIKMHFVAYRRLILLFPLLSGCRVATLHQTT
ncbi:hypothetical protein M378DRAFT_170201 [Amanita muscaria Koide BX008]|uniref:Uncharacterized protein n=1 Tax=Amanita muscaria (strain Koide BX008) TaxID=946122 RepID=A0A0C2S7I2_AMAMK|nr:hypothetical protein M378DRAFT_170201 [Amanita muscaria Koide BX008]